MTVRSIDELTPEARRQVEAYLAAVRKVLGATDAAAADEVVAELEADFCDQLTEDASQTDVERVVARLGEPSSFGPGTPPSDPTAPAGRLLGMPYDWRVMGVRATSRMWNPGDPRIIMPRLFGLGWTINLGAVAVRLGLIEPDAENEPFGSVSERAFMLALLIPVALTAGMLGSYLGLRTVLPAMLPTHWNAAGVVDGYWPQRSAFLLPFSFAAISTAAAVWAVATHRSPLSKGGYIGMASGLSALGAGIWALTLASTLRPPVNASLPALMILPAVLVPFAVLLGLARAGRNAEQRHDLARRGGTERA